MDKILEHIPLVIGLISFVGGSITWFDAVVRKRYAAERAVGHLTKNYESLSVNVAHLDRLLDERLDLMQREHLELKMLLQTLVNQSGANTAAFRAQHQQ